jgi:hypothetical protein
VVASGIIETMSEAPPRRRWFQFSLGTMLLLVALIAMGAKLAMDSLTNDQDVLVIVASMTRSRGAQKSIESHFGGIDWHFSDGTILTNIAVPRRDANVARRLLENSAFGLHLIKIDYADRQFIASAQESPP